MESSLLAKLNPDTLGNRISMCWWLSGLYVRNGSNPKADDSRHWFLGDGMLHGVRLQGGRAQWYRNRYIQTPQLAGTASGIPGGANTASNVSLVHHADKLLSLGEVGFPYHIDPADLGTHGPYAFDGALTTNMTAHPKIDPVTGELFFFGYGFTPPYLTYHVANAAGELIKKAIALGTTS
jgi:carotenoid cleavage dioxygenase-like enzyme